MEPTHFFQKIPSHKLENVYLTNGMVKIGQFYLRHHFNYLFFMTFFKFYFIDDLFIILFIYLLAYLYLFIDLSIYFFIYLLFCLFIYLLFYLFICYIFFSDSVCCDISMAFTWVTGRPVYTTRIGKMDVDAFMHSYACY